MLPNPLRVAARYKSKKEDGEGNVHYEYGPRQVANRHREKAERVEHLRKHISDLRERVGEDLKSEDPHTRMIALAVSLMDHTCERVGNDESADNGHYGVTGWLVKHVTVRDGKATIKYVGKSGVKHEKTVDHGPTVTALKKLLADRKDGEAIFDADDAKVTADDVNDYLAEFDVTAKDIRGFRANDEMCKALRAERSKGPQELPRARKEKDEILKAEFKRALEHVAEVVGHEAATLRSQYLVPGLEDEYVHDGTVLKSLKVATKSDSEREDEATEKLVKPSPKKKPPRHDLRSERVEAEADPDLDTTDDDLSLNFKKVAARSLVAAMASRVASRYLFAYSEGGEEDAFLEWAGDRKFTHPETKNKVVFNSLPDEEKSKQRDKWRKSQKSKGEDSGKDSEKGDSEEEDLAKEEARSESPATKDLVGDALKEMKVSASAEQSRGIEEVFDSVLGDTPTTGNVEDLMHQFRQSGRDILDSASKATNARDHKELLTVPKDIMSFGGKSPKLKSDTFDAEEVSSIIAANAAKRDATLSGIESSKDSLKKTKEKIREVSGSTTISEEAKADQIDALKKEAEGHQKKIQSGQEKLESQNKDLHRQAAYFAKMQAYVAHMSDPTKGSEDPSRRLTEVVALNAGTPSYIVEARGKRAEEEHARITKQMENASGKERRELQKGLDLLNAELAAAKFAKFTSEDSEGGKKSRGDEEDPTPYLVQKFKHLGVGNGHVQQLLLHGTDGKEGRKAVWNLASNLNDQDLVEMTGDKDLGDLLLSGDLDPESAAFVRKALLQGMLLKQSKGGNVSDEIDGLVKSTSSLASTVGKPALKNQLTVWLKGLSKKLSEPLRKKLESHADDIEGRSGPLRSKKPEKSLMQKARDFVQKMDISPEEKSKKLRNLGKMSPDDIKAMMASVLDEEDVETAGAAKTANVPGGLLDRLPSRVATRFLAYSMAGR